MRGAKDKIAKLEEKKSLLMKENQDLTIRAAVSFGELTPRPSFHKVADFYFIKKKMILIIILNFSSRKFSICQTVFLKIKTPKKSLMIYSKYAKTTF